MPTNSERIKALETLVSQLEAKIATLESAIKVDEGKAVKILAPTVEINAAAQLTLKGGMVLIN